jgi:hypothetical protein
LRRLGRYSIEFQFEVLRIGPWTGKETIKKSGDVELDLHHKRGLRKSADRRNTSARRPRR